MLKYIPLQLVLFQIIGILIGFYLSFSVLTITRVLTGVLILFTFIYFTNRSKIAANHYFMFSVFLAYIGVGSLSVTLKNELYQKNHYSSYISDGQDGAILVIDKITKSNTSFQTYNAHVIKVNSRKTHGKIKLNIFNDSILMKLNVDDKIIVFNNFEEIKPPLNPFQFNYKAYLAKQQIHHQLIIRSDQFLVLKSHKNSLKGVAFSVRARINKSLKKHDFKDDELAIINALLLGKRQDIPKNIIENYQNAGAIHLLAVSGLHVGVILLLLHFLLKPLEKLKFGRTSKFVIIVLLLWGFAFLAGLSASVVRAVTMYSAIAVALTTKSSINTYKALLISIFFLLLFNPFYIFDVGFQLSYFAVFFIVWLQPLLFDLWRPRFKIITYFWQLLTVTIAAQIGIVPLSLFYFHQFPGLFFVANLTIIPFLGIILGVGILVILLALLNLLPDRLAQLYENVIFLLNATVDWIAQKESFLFQNISFSPISVVLSYVLAIAFFKWFETKKPYFLKFFLFVLIFFQINLITERYLSGFTKELIIFNKSRHSILGLRKGRGLYLNHTLDSLQAQKENAVNAYLIGARVRLIPSNKLFKNAVGLNSEKLLIIDGSGVYPKKNIAAEYILLRSSPKINLERLIKNKSPEIIIADASNYKSYISLWKKTCEKHQIKFHTTAKDGAFIKKL